MAKRRIPRPMGWGSLFGASTLAIVQLIVWKSISQIERRTCCKSIDYQDGCGCGIFQYCRDCFTSSIDWFFLSCCHRALKLGRA